MLEKIKLILQGRKTYIVALSAIIGAILGWLNGQIEIVEAIRLIVEAILAVTIRAGIASK